MLCTSCKGQDMTRFDAVNFISHGIAKVPGQSEPETCSGCGGEAPSSLRPEKPNKKGNDALESYCINLNKKASSGRIDPLIGRESEIERTIQVLCRRSKNNPLYVGDPGVGKTAIAEGLARRIVHGEVPEVLKDATIFSARHGRAAGRHTLSRRFRGAAEGGGQ